MGSKRIPAFLGWKAKLGLLIFGDNFGKEKDFLGKPKLFVPSNYTSNYPKKPFSANKNFLNMLLGCPLWASV